uniref:Bardet-Biedl syndrome 12 protein n=1 Tax=Geotrypetes seraphini TaxID=260995 RepID=A0A6P8R6N7_GEOSA|nr:Bardet-Biedl syndrome 12 protein [Geotrypetes seraphini]XP_033794307.1 Bardet-Biedl syndrome 12 protein [Geotrypetes seraphini]XP_033794316.1 Bardet-Biedl syndrome 12 protein [Geotrypetes seraphini]
MAMTGRSHIGLQQLSSLTASARTLLGPVKFSKFIVDQSTHETVLTSSAFRLVEGLNLTSAVGQLLYETVQTHNKVYKTGTTSLLFLVGAWSSAALECLQQGIPVSLIASAMSEGLNSCIEEVQSLQIPLPNIYKKTVHESRPGDSFPPKLVPSQANVCLINKEQLTGRAYFQQKNPHDLGKINCEFPTSTAASSEPEHEPSHWILAHSFPSSRAKLTHSRHLNRSEKSCCQSQKFESSQEQAVDPAGVLAEGYHLGRLTMSLSHGSQHCMKLVEGVVACMQQNVDKMSNVHFDILDIVTCCLPGLSSSLSCVCSGYITSLSVESIMVVKHLQDKPLRCLLLEGDLTDNYRHVGFDRISNMKKSSDRINIVGSSLEDKWVKSAIKMLIELNVNLILVKGYVSESLVEQCIPKNILIISQVNHNVLQAFCEVTGAIPVTYLTQVTMCCVGTDTYVSIWKIDNSGTVHLDHGLVINVNAPRISLVTAVLGNALPAKMQAMEDEFWSCAYRLNHALMDQKVFIGGGGVELLCISHLQKLETLPLKQKNKRCTGKFDYTSSWLAGCADHYKANVLKAMADGWFKYIATVMCNTTKCRSELEARTLIQNHLQKISKLSSPIAYICKEYTKDLVYVDFPNKSEDKFEIYDSVTPKLEAWRQALDLTLLVLQTDAEILTGSWTSKQLLSSRRSVNEFVLL